MKSLVEFIRESTTPTNRHVQIISTDEEIHNFNVLFAEEFESSGAKSIVVYKSDKYIGAFADTLYVTENIIPGFEGECDLIFPSEHKTIILRGGRPLTGYKIHFCSLDEESVPADGKIDKVKFKKIKKFHV